MTGRARKTWPQFVAAFMANDLLRICRRHDVELTDCGLSGQALGFLLAALYEGKLDRQVAREAIDIVIRDFVHASKQST